MGEKTQVAEARATLSYARISARKVKIVADLLRGKKVEEILLNEVSNNPRYSSELVEACTLNEEGMFNIPLFDEVQSKRVQQLLLSVIRDRITKQKIKGGTLWEKQS